MKLTNEEVLEAIKRAREDEKSSEIMKAIDDVVIDALEKQIPKMPLQVPYEENPLRTFKCPNCGSYDLREYCNDCGQRLLWKKAK